MSQSTVSKYTQCPKCSTYFRVTEEHLKAAHGKVRCGQCKHVFNGRKYLLDKLPASKDEDRNEGLPATAIPAEHTAGANAFLDLAATPNSTAVSATPMDDSFIITDAGDELDIDLQATVSEAAKTSKPTTDSADTPGHEVVETETRPSGKTPAPAPILDLERDRRIPFHLRNSLELKVEKRRSVMATLGLGLLSLLLLALLAGQVIFFRAEDVKRHVPEIKYYVNLLCSYVPCQYSGKRDVSQILLDNRDVRSHPRAKNALMISATFTNTASFSQPYPRILLTLSDLSGSIVAQRIFSPQEYLGKLYDNLLLMDPETPVHVTLEVLDPGAEAINFEFKFL